ncbi:uncharacterized protein I303_108435 [Kwoniella dejecticola CBS 10117]|uniref:rRNA biogenesis protein RRP36 n=1 Tax=Kwoniella dejecticola CBS 10117 TaxID=1296121 RepID=A0A1A5ZXE1_9TREE|nr:uncharacterized protein I303_07240 [Kwoniella dejecticola CBS 10117]OBR82480.1 hypothetical protein I303_07240 [Kwoniella dejecticola CBS 10117]
MARGSSSKLKQHPRAPSTQDQDIEDDYLEDDSEVDEFADDYDSPPEGDGIDNDLEDETEEEEEEGTGRWEADDWDENDDSHDSQDSQSGSDSEDEDDAQLKQLQNDLTSLPLSTLAKAQKSLSSAKQASSSGSSKEDRVAAIKAKLAQMQKGKGKASAVDPYAQASNHGVTTNGSESESESGSDSGPESGSTKRGSKHAPTAMSTKKQVSRNRRVVDIHKPDRRDPRFSSVSAGNLDAHLHNASYDFLPSMLKEEMANLRTALKTAEKVERSCPWAEKPMRTAEREAIELQLGRLRTKLVKHENEERERNVLSKVKKEERAKRAEGKGAWYLKKSEKRDLLLKSKFESLEQKGGKTAVKKALEKKRKKIASKEKKSRPFAKGAGAGVGDGSGSGGDQRKRQRV